VDLVDLDGLYQLEPTALSLDKGNFYCDGLMEVKPNVEHAEAIVIDHLWFMTYELWLVVVLVFVVVFLGFGHGRTVTVPLTPFPWLISGALSSSLGSSDILFRLGISPQARCRPLAQNTPEIVDQVAKNLFCSSIICCTDGCTLYPWSLDKGSHKNNDGLNRP